MNDLMICPVKDKCKANIGHDAGCRQPHKKTIQCDNGCSSTPEHTGCIPYNAREFKIGDKVRVLGKTYGCTLSETAYFNPKDLELIKEDDKIMNEKNENKMEYKATGKILKPSALADSTTDNEFENFFTNYLRDKCEWNIRSLCLWFDMELTVTKKLIEYAQKHDCFIKWLVKKGYVELIEPEIFYKRGDRFKYIGIGIYSGAEFMISSYSGDMVILTNLKDGGWWSSSVSVKDYDMITVDEFSIITGVGKNSIADWKKINH